MRNRKSSLLGKLAKNISQELHEKGMFALSIPRWVILLLDMILIGISYLLVIASFRLLLNQPSPDGLTLRFILTVLIYAIYELITRVYKGTVRYSGLNEMTRLFMMVSLSTITTIVLSSVVEHFSYVPALSPIWIMLHGALSFLLLFLLRIVVKYTYYFLSSLNHNKKRVAIYGSDTHAISLAQQLTSDSESIYKPVALIQEGHTLDGVRIANIPVVKSPSSAGELQQLIQLYHIDKILFLDAQLKSLSTDTIDMLLNANIKLFVVGGTTDLRKRDGKQAPRVSVHEIRIEDLLDREVIKTDNAVVAERHVGKVVLVTGAAGSIGSEISLQVARYSPQLLVILDQAESPLHDLEIRLRREHPELNLITYIGDVTNKTRMMILFESFMPEIVYHAAAYKHVPMMERYPCEAVRVNVLGTKTMADLAVQYKARKFIMVSTDKAVNPTNVMGASKRIAEIYVQSLFLSLEHLHTEHRRRIRFITTRFGNVLGSNGSVVPLFKDQIAKGGPVTLTHKDIIRYFMTIPEACRLVLEAGCMGSGGEIFVFDMGEPVKIYDLATRMIRLAGLIPGEDIDIVETGLRPGEKLYEELLNDEELTMPTHHEKIMVAKVREYNFDEIHRYIDAMIKCALENNQMETVRQMKCLVPEFKSRNSIYEELDIETETAHNS
ncbi:MAG: polysaccharide biosynthesis protein [Bacteroidales bacterium]